MTFLNDEAIFSAITPENPFPTEKAAARAAFCVLFAGSFVFTDEMLPDPGQSGTEAVRDGGSAGYLAPSGEAVRATQPGAVETNTP